MKVLIIGGPKTKEFTSNEIDRTDIKLLTPKEITVTTFEQFLPKLNTFDKVLFHVDEIRKILPGTAGYLQSVIKAIDNPDSLVVVIENKKARENLTSKLKGRAILVAALEEVPFFKLKEKDNDISLQIFDDLIEEIPEVNVQNISHDSKTSTGSELSIPTLSNKEMLDFLNEPIEKEIDTNPFDDLGLNDPLNNDPLSALLATSTAPTPPQMPNNDIDSILNSAGTYINQQNQNAPFDEIPRPMNNNQNIYQPNNEQNILDILGNIPASLPTSENNSFSQQATNNNSLSIDDILNMTPNEPISNTPDMYGVPNAGLNDNNLDSILNSPREFNQSSTMGIKIETPAPAHFIPGADTNRSKYMIDESEIPDATKSSRKLDSFIDKIVGSGKMDANKLPGIPENALPTNLRRPYILTFWASKGGTGKTTVALNTCAYISALTNLKVILVDVDEFGDTGLSVGMMKSAAQDLPTVDDFLSHISTMKTYEDVSHFILTETDTRLNILLSSPNSSTPNRPTKDDYQNVLKTLQNHFDIIAFDCGDKLWDDITRFALIRADFLLMVVDQGFPTLSHISDVIEDFAGTSTGIGKDKIIMVVNKYQKDVGMSIQDIGQWFGGASSSIHIIPAIFYEAMKNLNENRLLILTNNAEIKKAYNRIVIDILTKIKENQEQSQGQQNMMSGMAGMGQGGMF